MTSAIPQNILTLQTPWCLTWSRMLLYGHGGFTLTFNSFCLFYFLFFCMPWGQSWNCVHFSSLQHKSGATSYIHLCCGTVSESDWDLQTFKMITLLHSLFISLSASICQSPPERSLFTLPLPLLFLLHLPSLSFCPSPRPLVQSGLRQIVLLGGGTRAGGQQKSSVFPTEHV